MNTLYRDLVERTRAGHGTDPGVRDAILDAAGISNDEFLADIAPAVERFEAHALAEAKHEFEVDQLVNGHRGVSSRPMAAYAKRVI